MTKMNMNIWHKLKSFFIVKDYDWSQMNIIYFIYIWYCCPFFSISSILFDWKFSIFWLPRRKFFIRAKRHFFFIFSIMFFFSRRKMDFLLFSCCFESDLNFLSENFFFSFFSFLLFLWWFFGMKKVCFFLSFLLIF